MDAVIARMSGGLGNQLFQYAAGKALAKRLQVPLTLDLTQFEEKKDKRQFSLATLGVEFLVADRTSLLNIHRRHDRQRKLQRGARKFPWLSQLVAKRDPQIFLETDIGYSPLFEAIKRPVYLSGNWMSERYFTSVAVDLASELTRCKSLTTDATVDRQSIRNGNWVSLHVRLTDYLTTRNAAKYKGSCDVSYYRRAMNTLSLFDQNMRFLVFSDDIAGARDILGEHKHITFAPPSAPENPLGDFALMMACKHHIIANSTYSWWSAWLNPSPSKIVVAPRHWFSRSYTRRHDCGDIVPPGWLTIENDNFGY